MPKRKSPRSDPDPRWTSELPPAPGELRIVQAFVNTADLARGTDLDGPEALVRWLAHWSLAPESTELDDADFRRALETREDLRALIRAHRGPAVSSAVTARLDAAARPGTLRVRFGEDGRTRFEATSDHLDGALARLCAIVAAAQLDGSWERLKVCSGRVCRAVFYDFSRNRSAKYCNPRCSSGASSLAFRHRNLDEIRKTDREKASVRRLFGP